MNAVEEGKEKKTKLLRNERQIKVQMQIKVRCIRLIKGQLVKRIEPKRRREREREEVKGTELKVLLSKTSKRSRRVTTQYSEDPQQPQQQLNTQPKSQLQQQLQLQLKIQIQLEIQMHTQIQIQVEQQLPSQIHRQTM